MDRVLAQQQFNCLLKSNIRYSSKSKAFEDNKLDIIQELKCMFKRFENILENGENATC